MHIGLEIIDFVGGVRILCIEVGKHVFHEIAPWFWVFYVLCDLILVVGLFLFYEKNYLLFGRYGIENMDIEGIATNSEPFAIWAKY